jgi:hypothetical protein
MQLPGRLLAASTTREHFTFGAHEWNLHHSVFGGKG